jgi:hypothetical protein
VTGLSAYWDGGSLSQIIKNSWCSCGIIFIEVKKRGRRRFALKQNLILYNITQNFLAAHSYGGVHQETGNADTSLPTVII